MTPTTSLRSQVRATFIASIVAALLVSALGGLAFDSLLEARRDLVDRADPALLAVERLLAGLVDQETAVRGYVISDDVASLEPFGRGETAVAQQWSELDRLSKAFSTVPAQLEEVAGAVARWRGDYADPTIAGVQRGEPSVATPEALDAGRARFDEVRAAVGRLQDRLVRERTSAEHELDAVTVRLVLALLLLAAVMVAIVAALWRLVRRQVERPLLELGDDARVVAGGELAHPIEPVGPAELFELGLAMEQMRQRILADLTLATEARDQLERQSDDLARSNAELEQFAYVASHDLQEPLRKVASFCQLLQSRYGGQLDERADQYIEFAVDGAKRMQDLINDLLAFSRVGRVDAGEATVVDVGALVERARLHLGTAIGEAGARLEVGPLPDVRIEQSLGVALFQNLIGNAIKFRRPGVAPTIRITSTDRGDRHELRVEDDGIGIEPEYAERVFAIFQRLHTRDLYEGTGIGLAMCRKIVEHQGGTIWVDTDRAIGTSIRFSLPKVTGAS